MATVRRHEEIAVRETAEHFTRVGKSRFGRRQSLNLAIIIRPFTSRSSQLVCE